MSEGDSNKDLKVEEFLKTFVLSLYHKKIISKNDEEFTADIETFMAEFQSDAKDKGFKVSDAKAMCAFLQKAGFQPISIDSGRNLFVFPSRVILKRHAELLKKIDALILHDIEALAETSKHLEYNNETPLVCQGRRDLPAQKVSKKYKFVCKLCVESFATDKLWKCHIKYHNSFDETSGILSDLSPCNKCEFSLSCAENNKSDILCIKLRYIGSHSIRIESIVIILRDKLYGVRTITFPKNLKANEELLFYVKRLAVERKMSDVLPICVLYTKVVRGKHRKAFALFCRGLATVELEHEKSFVDTLGDFTHRDKTTELVCCGRHDLPLQSAGLYDHIHDHNNGMVSDLRTCNTLFRLSFVTSVENDVLCLKLASVLPVIIESVVMITKKELYELKSITFPQNLGPREELIFYLKKSVLDENASKEMPICISYIQFIRGRRFRAFQEFRVNDDSDTNCENDRGPLTFGKSSENEEGIHLDYSQRFPMALFSTPNFVADIRRLEPSIDEYIKNDLELTPTNYLKVMEFLAQCEYYETMKLYESLNQKAVRLWQQCNGYWDEEVYEVEMNRQQNTLPIADILRIGDVVTIKLEEEIYEGLVHKVNRAHVYISVRSILPLGLYDLEFTPAGSIYDHQMHALTIISKWDDSTFRQKLFPEEALARVPVTGATLSKVYNESIRENPEQLKCVTEIAKGTGDNSPPYIIFGPPGTGKTTTVVEAIVQLYFQSDSNRILIAMGANAAADDLSLRLLKILSREESNPAFLRIYSKSKVKAKDSIDPLLFKHSNMLERSYPSVNAVHEDFRIVVCTCHVVGIMATKGFGSHGDVFTHVFVDEAAALTETDVLIVLAASVKASTKVILSGDHKQLGPVLQSKTAQTFHFGKSMMQRLYDRPIYLVGKSVKTDLRQNYRSHPDIVKIYNDLFYDGNLIAICKPVDHNISERWYLTKRDCQYPVLFHDVRGYAETYRNGFSLFNVEESKVVLSYVCELLYFGINGVPLKQEDIGVISPYKSQYRRLKDDFEARGWNNVLTSSVESFQGQERKVVIVSFVRTNRKGFGFLGDSQRLNVSLSRPQSLLVLVGDADYLAGQNEWFKSIIETCKINNTFIKNSS